ncbi:alkylphosphonate utilization protein [bacterium]|nr:alkylphosphonate utilization protein [bacterium]
MEVVVHCPNCNSPYGYPTEGTLWMCPECSHEWNIEGADAEADTSTETMKILDANGNQLQDGDSVVVVKDLPVKGFAKAIKAGTKIKNIRLTDGDHNIDCKIDGFGAMALKSEFVKKA